MKLTQTHIQQLYKFTREHFVYHYDVQTELVDHLANDIESTWEETPKKAFEDARDASFKKFGIFGFMDVIEAKQKQMNKRYRAIMWRFVKEWFTIPKMRITMAIFFSLFLFLGIQNSEYILLGFLLLLVVGDMRNLYIAKKNEKRKEKKNEKIFLLEAMIGDVRNGFTGAIFINICNFTHLTRVSFSDLETHWLLLISFSVTVLLILFYVTGYVMPQKAEELLAETYPEYKLAKNL
jgi:hypothetical protein